MCVCVCVCVGVGVGGWVGVGGSSNRVVQSTKLKLIVFALTRKTFLAIVLLARQFFDVEGQSLIDIWYISRY